MHYAKAVLMGILLSGLVACSTPSPQSVAKETAAPPVSKQVTANSIQPVKVPRSTATTTVENSENSYSVPDSSIPQTTGTKNTSLAPPGSNLAQMTQQNTVTTKTVATPAAVTTTTSSAPMSLKLAYPQAWEKVGKALPAAGYRIMDQDSSLGTYYILDTVSSGGVIKRDTPIYQVHLEKQGQKTAVTVLNMQNQPADSKVTSRLLGALH